MLSVGCGFLCVNANLLAGTLRLKTHNAVNLCKQSVILSDTYVGSGMEMSAALPYEDVSCQNELTVGTLRTKTLGFAVTTVAGRAYALLMSKELQVDVHHRVTPSFLKY